MRLRDKVVIVTGSTTGIGEAIARRVVMEGGYVLVHGLEEKMGREVVESLDDSAVLHIDDLALAQAPARIVQAALDAFGRIDSLVNNAATTKRGNLRSLTPPHFDHVMHINLRAPLLLAQAAIDALIESRGTILNVGSINAYCGEPNLLVYSASKGALMTATRNLSDVFGADGVRVNQINVGWTFTPNENRLKISEGLEPGWENRVPAAFAPSGTILRPEQVAEAAVYWIGDESRPVSGSIVEIAQVPMIGRNPQKDF